MSSAPKSGSFITFEGPEGAGKSTQIAALAEHLRGRGLTVVLTREPGGTPLGEQIRHLLKHSACGEGMSAETELLLFAASRAQLVREVIKPALQTGAVILSDRFLDSSTVYQGIARKLPEAAIQMLNAFAVGQTLPDLTFVLDVPEAESLRRIGARGSIAPDRMEQQDLEFYRRVREGYLGLAERHPERVRIINAHRSAELVRKDIEAEVSRLLFRERP